MTAQAPPDVAGTLTIRGETIVYASEGVAALAGRTVQEMVGHPFAEFIVEEERALVVERAARRRRGEPVPQRYEITLALPGGGRRPVEVHIDRAGEDVLVHVRDSALRAARRLRLEAVATLGAALQREPSEEGIFSRLRDGLGTLGLSCALLRAEPEGVRILWASVPPALAQRFHEMTAASLDGHLGRWNEFSRRVYAEGSTFTEDWGKAVSEFVPEALAAAARAMVTDAGLTTAAGVRLGERDDADQHLVVAGSWLGGEDAPALRLLAAQLAAALGAARTISDLSRRNEDLAALNRVAEIAGEASDVAGFLERTSAVLRATAGCSGTALFVLDEAAGELVRAYADGTQPEAAARFERFSLSSPLGTIMAGPSAGVVDAAEVPHPAIQQLGFRSVARVPLIARSKTVGVLALGFQTPAAEVRRRLGLVCAVGAHVAAAVESHGLLSDLRRRVGELTLLNDVALATAEHDPVALLDAAVQRVRDTVGSDLGAAYVREEARLVLVAEGGMEPACARDVSILPVGEGAVGLAVERGVPVQAASLGLHSDGRDCPCGEIRAVAAVPLLAKGQAVGALLLGRREPRGFSPGEIRLLSAIGLQLGLAVDAARLFRDVKRRAEELSLLNEENARLYAEARRRAEELGLLHEVGRSLVETLDIQQLLERGVENLARIVDAPAASLLLVTEDGKSLEVRAVSGTHGVHLGMRLPVESESSLAALVARRREPVLIEDGLGDPRVNPILRGQTGARGYLGLPLLVRERTIGAVIIMELRGPRLFAPPEVERAAAIANQLAVAVENARLYEDLRRSYAELEHAQHRLIQRERLAALGELSAVVAHEVRNPLGVIFNSLGSLRRLVRPTGDAKLLLDIVGEEADRLNRIVGDLLDFARPSTPQLRPERIESVVEEAVGAALAQKPAEVEIVRHLDPAVPPVPMDARLVRQAVLNVAVNAVQAMPRGGRITLRTRRAGDAVVLEIEDTGAGIPADVSARIFEPFFTTKASGTGLGLAVVKRIVEGHGGAVAVRNQPGAGAVFSLSFPLAAGPVEKEPALG